jgi:hypothetical protein
MTVRARMIAAHRTATNVGSGDSQTADAVAVLARLGLDPDAA